MRLKNGVCQDCGANVAADEVNGHKKFHHRSRIESQKQYQDQIAKDGFVQAKDLRTPLP